MPASISEYVPQLATGNESARRARAAWAVTLAIALAFVGVIVAAPLLRARGSLLLSQAIYQGFHTACHQMPERSFHLEGFPLAVCARCFGLYAGGLAGLLIYPLARGLKRMDAPHRTWLFLAALPTSVDFALGLFGVWENTHWSRFLTAFLLGACSAFYILPGAVGLAFRYRPRRVRAIIEAS
jgi:uncharacterized membrane protein